MPQDEKVTLNSWESKLIPKFSEGEIGKFFNQFEKVAIQLGWSEDLWVIIVQSVFIGKAQLVYSTMSEHDSANYHKSKRCSACSL